MPTQLTFVRFAWKNLWRRRLRTLLTLAGIGMAMGAFVCLVGFSRAFEQAWRQMYANSGTDIAVVAETFLNTTIDQSVGAKLQTLPVIADAAPMTLNFMSLSADVNAIAYGWKADSFEFSAISMTAGRRFRNGQPEIILGELLADGLKKHVGDSLEIQGATFNVVGVFHGGSALEAGAVIMPLDQMQKLSSLEGKVTAFHVRLKPLPAGETQEHYMARAQGQIESALPGVRAVPAAERASNNQLVLLAHATAWGTSSIALLIGILGIANTMAMSVFERTREIGVLRALGWNSRRVLLLIQLEAAALGTAGGLLGILFGWLALRLLAHLPQTASIVSTSFPPLILAEALAIAIAAGLLAGFLPAWRGARLSPVEALRYE
jgi:putative ABC transport system permease protein